MGNRAALPLVLGIAPQKLRIFPQTDCAARPPNVEEIGGTQMCPCFTPQRQLGEEVDGHIPIAATFRVQAQTRAIGCDKKINQLNAEFEHDDT